MLARSVIQVQKAVSYKTEMKKGGKSSLQEVFVLINNGI